MSERTIAIYFVHAILRNMGADKSHRLLLEKDISPKILEQPRARIAADDYVNLLQGGMELLGDEGLGYYSRPLPLGTWEIACQAAISADTLGEALERFCRLYRLFEWGPKPRISKSDNIATLFIGIDKQADKAPYLFETFLFYAYRFANWLIAEQIPLTQLSFCFPEPEHAAEYHFLFLGCSIDYDQPHTGLSFSKHFLDTPIKQTNATLKEFLKHPNYSMVVRQFDQRSWHYKVSTLLSKRVAEIPSLEEISTELQIHPQTLRRNLIREGFEYREIKNRVRCDAAIHLLRNVGKSVEETAFAVGFSDTSNFVKSFKSWTGVTPHTYKKQ